MEADIQQDFQGDPRAGDHEASSCDFQWVDKNEGLEGSAHSETEKQTAHRVRVGDAGAPATLGSFVSPIGGDRMMVVHLDRLAPYQGVMSS